MVVYLNNSFHGIVADAEKNECINHIQEIVQKRLAYLDPAVELIQKCLPIWIMISYFPFISYAGIQATIADVDF